MPCLTVYALPGVACGAGLSHIMLHHIQAKIESAVTTAPSQHNEPADVPVGPAVQFLVDASAVVAATLPGQTVRTIKHAETDFRWIQVVHPVAGLHCNVTM